MKSESESRKVMGNSSPNPDATTDATPRHSLLSQENHSQRILSNPAFMMSAQHALHMILNPQPATFNKMKSYSS